LPGPRRAAGQEVDRRGGYDPAARQDAHRPRDRGALREDRRGRREGGGGQAQSLIFPPVHAAAGGRADGAGASRRNGLPPDRHPLNRKEPQTSPASRSSPATMRGQPPPMAWRPASSSGRKPECSIRTCAPPSTGVMVQVTTLFSPPCASSPEAFQL